MGNDPSGRTISIAYSVSIAYTETMSMDFTQHSDNFVCQIPGGSVGQVWQQSKIGFGDVWQQDCVSYLGVESDYGSWSQVGSVTAPAD